MLKNLKQSDFIKGTNHQHSVSATKAQTPFSASPRWTTPRMSISYVCHTKQGKVVSDILFTALNQLGDV